MFKTSALKITETFLYLYPEIKFNYCVDATAKCLAADGINSEIHIPLEGIHNTNLEGKTKLRTHDYSNSVITYFALTLTYHSLK